MPTAVLLTSKGDAFTFQPHEKATFTCDTACYPYPEVIEFKVGSKVFDSTTPGVSDYEVDITSSNVRVHMAKFSVLKISGKSLFFLLTNAVLHEGLKDTAL